MGGLNPEAAVLVTTIRSLKMHGGQDRKSLATENLDALERGLPMLEHHVRNVQQFGVPMVVSLNRILSDTEGELRLVMEFASRLGVKVVLTDVWARGGAGGEELAREVLALLDAGGARFAPLYETRLPIRQKIDIIVRRVYGADGADYAPAAERSIDYLESIGL